MSEYERVLETERERGNEDKSIYGSEKCDQESKLREED